MNNSQLKDTIQKTWLSTEHTDQMLGLSAYNRARIGMVPGASVIPLNGGVEGTGGAQTMARGLANGQFLNYDRTTAQTMAVASTHNTEDAAGAVGAQQVIVEYIDLDGNRQLTLPPITLNGNTVVSLGVDAQCVNRVVVVNSGINRTNTGTIYVGRLADTWGLGIPTQVWNLIAPGVSVSVSPWYCVPNGFCLAVNEMSITSDSVSKNDTLICQIVTHAINSFGNETDYKANKVHVIGSFQYDISGFPCLRPGNIFEVQVSAGASVDISVTISATELDLSIFPDALASIG